MTNSDLITIVIPYHHRSDYLQQTIDSVTRQTLLPAQLIIIDNSAEGDGATYIAHYPGPSRHILSPRHRGAASYFNQCLDSVETPWCTILHGDDLLLPHYVQTMSRAIQQYPQATGLFCLTETINAASRKIFCFKDWAKIFLWPGRNRQTVIAGETGLAALLRGNFIMCPTMCYQVAILGGMRFDAKWKCVLDMDLNGRLLLHGHFFVGLRQKLYTYRRHGESITALGEKNFEMFIEAAQCTRSLAGQAGAKGWRRAASRGKRSLVGYIHIALHLLRHARLHNISAIRQYLNRYKEAKK